MGNPMAVQSDGSLWIWGADEDRMYFRDITDTSHQTPVKVLDDVVAISSGIGSRETSHVLAIRTDGSLWTWGFNGAGQLGDGTTEDRHTPIRVMEGMYQPVFCK